MCRNYDAGQCDESGCIARVTCHDFNDHRCIDHSYNGRFSVIEDDDEVTLALAREVIQ